MRWSSRTLSGREKRLLAYLAILLLVVGWYFWRARWSPALTLQSAHYVIYSTATTNQTGEIAAATESLYQAYADFFQDFPKVGRPHAPLSMKLYKDREEFRRCNPRLGWAEAFYRKPYCHAYYSAEEINSLHWMLHEVVHQLNAEVADFDLPQWLDEGLADYFGSSRLVKGHLLLGTIDPNTYPVWWIDALAISGKLDADIKNKSIIPLKAILTGKDGPSLRSNFNLYYLHWWTLTHFLLQGQNGKYREGFFEMVAEGGSLGSFEKNIGPVGKIQKEWYAHVKNLKRALALPEPVPSLQPEKAGEQVTR